MNKGKKTSRKPATTKRSEKAGKRRLYHPSRGSSNWEVAEGGRFAGRFPQRKGGPMDDPQPPAIEQQGSPIYPAYFACKELAGALYALRLVDSDLQRINVRSKILATIKLRVSAIFRQIDQALAVFDNEAKRLKGRGDKLRFAEAIVAFFDRQKRADDTTLSVCFRVIELRVELHGDPSQKELRDALKTIDELTFSDDKWKRLMRSTGLNRELPTHLEKMRRGRSA